MTGKSSPTSGNPPPKRPEEPPKADDPKNKDDKTDNNDDKKREDAAMKAYEQILMQFMNDTFSKLVEEAASQSGKINESSPMEQLFEGEE